MWHVAARRGPCQCRVSHLARAGLVARHDSRRAVTYGENEAAQASASWLSGGRFSAPDRAPGCPELRPASANQPLGPHWPATPAVFSA